jgi:hypothetical protein
MADQKRDDDNDEISLEEAISLTVTELFKVDAPREAVAPFAFDLFLCNGCSHIQAFEYAKMTLQAWENANT